MTTTSTRLSGVSLIVEGALLPGHGLDGPWHGGRLERRRSVRMKGVANGVNGGEGPLRGQGESVLVLLQGSLVGGRWRTARGRDRGEDRDGKREE